MGNPIAKLILVAFLLPSFHSPAASAERPRAPFTTLYSNDTTNIMSSISLYRMIDRASTWRLMQKPVWT